MMPQNHISEMLQWGTKGSYIINRILDNYAN